MDYLFCRADNESKLAADGGETIFNTINFFIIKKFTESKEETSKIRNDGRKFGVFSVWNSNKKQARAQTTHEYSYEEEKICVRILCYNLFLIVGLIQSQT